MITFIKLLLVLNIFGFMFVILRAFTKSKHLYSLTKYGYILILVSFAYLVHEKNTKVLSLVEGVWPFFVLFLSGSLGFLIHYVCRYMGWDPLYSLFNRNSSRVTWSMVIKGETGVANKYGEVVKVSKSSDVIMKNVFFKHPNHTNTFEATFDRTIIVIKGEIMISYPYSRISHNLKKGMIHYIERNEKMKVSTLEDTEIQLICKK